MVTEVSFPCLRWSTAMMLAFLVDPLSRSISLQYCAAVREMYTPSAHQVDWAQHFPSWIPEKNHASGQVSQIQDQQLGTPEQSLAKECGRDDLQMTRARNLVTFPLRWTKGRADWRICGCCRQRSLHRNLKPSNWGKPTSWSVTATSPLERRKKGDKKLSLQSTTRWMRFCSK